jgi:exodeoxyribonuclease-5
VTWSPQQDSALRAVAEWRRGGAQVFYLAGFAGTGKTTLAKGIPDDADGKVLFAAFTGKAASVLRAKGCDDASTIHSLVYRFVEEQEGKPLFELNADSPIRQASLLIVDECSMVDRAVGADLLSFNTKLLVLGDPAQLPPVNGGGFFTEQEPDVMLTEVHRQARDNPIIRMSLTVREGRHLAYGQYGDSRVIASSPDGVEILASAADQLLVGLNRTRRLYNARLCGDPKTAMPIAGDKLVCLRNSHERGLLNGELWMVENVLETQTRAVIMRVVAQDGGGRSTEIKVHPAFFEGRQAELPWWESRKSDQFDFGYALTVHKAQGSQWNTVVLVDESAAFRENRNRWLYTAITRAASNIAIVR